MWSLTPLSALGSLQPSYKIFCLFDRLCLLSKGSVVFNGPVLNAEPYFVSLGYVTPRAENPADFFMRVLQLGPEPDDDGFKSCDLVGLWGEKGWEYEAIKASPEAAPSDGASEGGVVCPDLKLVDVSYSVPPWYQTVVLFHRCFLDAIKWVPLHLLERAERP